MYDSIILGSGPISLIEAMHLSSQRQRVLILEKSGQLGGAWGTVQHGDLPPLEIGCHIWDVDSSAFKFISELTGLQLKALKPQPKIISGSVTVPYDWKNLVFMLRESAGSLRQGSVKGAFSQLGKGLKKGSRILPARYLYPQGGAAQFSDRLIEMLEESEVEVRLESAAHKIEITDKGITIQVGDDLLSAKEAVLTTFSQIHTLLYPGCDEEESGLHAERRWIHYHLHLKDQKAPDFSYLRIMKHPLIHRLSDITHQLQYHQKNKPGERVILAGVHASAFDKTTDPERVDGLLSYLRAKKLISKDAELISAGFNVYGSRYFGGKELEKALESSNGKLRSLHSTNLIYGIRKQLHRWQDLISQ